MLMMNQILGFGTVSNRNQGVNAVDYNGSGDYLNKATDFTGLADSKTGIFSVWLRIDGGNSSQMFLLTTGGSSPNAFYVQRTAGNVFEFRGRDTGGSGVLLMSTVNSYTSSATWIHVLASWDLAASATHIYISDVSDKTTTTATNTNINYTDAPWLVGSSAGIGSYWNGCMAELYFAPGQYLDFSNSANRRKFISALGKPVDLGIDGSTPTGTSPILYLKNPAATVGTNSGTGGNMTINGAPTTASSSPSD